MKIAPFLFTLLFCGQLLAQETPNLSQANNFANAVAAAFEENKGQVWDMDQRPANYVKYHYHQKGLHVFLLPTGIAYQFNKMHYPEGYQHDTKHLNAEEREKQDKLNKEVRLETYRMDMELLGANPHARILAEGKSKDYVNYYNRNTLDVHSFEKLTYQDIYPGIDWVIYKTDEGLKYDFVVAPGANPQLIQMRFKDHEQLFINADGSFTLRNRIGQITEQAPVSFQGDQKVATQFVLNENTIQFQLGDYAPRQPLVIDPNLIWATYYGGSDTDIGYDCALDNQGDIYLTGKTISSNNIAVGGHQNTYGGGTSQFTEGDAFLVKFDSSGARQWATYYGGSLPDEASSCVVDAFGSIYMAGITRSSNNIAFNGHQTIQRGSDDAFLVKFNANGFRQWATYYGGNEPEEEIQCTVDAQGNVFITGETLSTTAIAFNGHQNSLSRQYYDDVFLVKFDSSGARQWATYYGGLEDEYNPSCATDA